MRIFSPILFILICSTVSYGQQIELFKSSPLPAEAYGGVEEMQHLVNLQMNYPSPEYENGINGEVFVLLKIDAEGKLISKTAVGESNENFKIEALRLSELFLWEKNKSREPGKVKEEKIKFTFSKKKYDKVVKKRGYKVALVSLPDYYTLKQLEVAPEVLKYKNLNEFVTENIKYPSLALQQGISGVVKVEFIIEANGKISNINIIKPVAGGCNEETKRLLNKTNWKAGMIDEKSVRTLYSYSLNFVHPGNTYH